MTGNEKSGAELLFKAITIWSTNVMIFGLWYWAVDQGGPVRRVQLDPPPHDFQFPQDENPELAEPDWRTHLVDYVYVSFTNSIAFSPTDAMPLTRRAKLLMLIESSVSAMTILLVRGAGGEHPHVTKKAGADRRALPALQRADGVAPPDLAVPAVPVQDRLLRGRDG